MIKPDQLPEMTGTPKERLRVVGKRIAVLNALNQDLSSQQRTALAQRKQEDRTALERRATRLEDVYRRAFDEYTEAVWWNGLSTTWIVQLFKDSADTIESAYVWLEVLTQQGVSADEHDFFQETQDIVQLYEAHTPLLKVLGRKCRALIELEKRGPLYPLTQDFLDRYRPIIEE